MGSEPFIISTSRKPLPDLLKGLAVLAMVQVHIMEVFASPLVFNGLAGKISLFLGGPFAAPVFLSIMGYFLAASRKKTARKIKRGFYLIILGLVLNVGMNCNLLLKIISGEVQADPWRFIFGVDILINAGLSIILVAAMELLLRKRTGAYLLVAVAVPFLGMLLPAREHHATWLDYLQAFIMGRAEWSYFPLIPWSAYVFLGYAFHCAGKEYPAVFQRVRQARYIILPFLLLLLFASGGIYIEQVICLQEYYHHGPGLFAWITLFLITWLMITNEAETAFGNSGFFLWIKWLGRNVTAVYVIQWLIIGNIGTELYRTQFLFPSLLWFAGIMALTCILVFYGKKAYGFLMHLMLKA